MKFEEVIGQHTARERLLQLVSEDRVPHAMMLCGPAGAGKMALALAFASYLLCRNHEQGDSCGNCPQCIMLRKWEHPDLHFVYPVIRPAGTSAEHKMVSDDFSREWHHLIAQGPYFTLDQWLAEMGAANQQAQIGAGESDALLRKLSLKSSQGGYKVSLIWLPERMNAECANKLLKLLEEPPMQTVFIMVCEEPEYLIETIRSRVQRIDVPRIGEEAIREALISRRGIDEESAARIARIAGGSWLKALDQLDAGNENRQFLDMFEMLMRLAYMRNVRDMKKWSEVVAAYGRERQLRLLSYFGRMIRENFVYNFRQPELCYMTQDEESFSRNFSRFVNERNVVEISELIARTQRDIRQNANAKMAFFDFALKMIVLIKR
ncbi:ATP-binding protein [Prevotella sp. kh1p2]|uniref:DNA polymerase III subunit n=1 Tax=Prevotella sp. kh1p2 TaxID=1761883 RepID=UPI0008CD10C6|nr:DNA polymerase III subunit delta' [Prevotella sp. kh1p2]SES63471.1 DNA polymerase-3 subunit delta' [Prevotella sp. kh1p2]SNU10136.1 DNA polymerase-3 subunit delta' [Prevotellaceae bacterium KH2P17]